MTWFMKKKPASVPETPSGSLRIVRMWAGDYAIEAYSAYLTGSGSGMRLRKHWGVIEDAGRFNTPEAAVERIRFMGRLDTLTTEGEA